MNGKTYRLTPKGFDFYQKMMDVIEAAENLCDALGSAVNPSAEYMMCESRLRDAVRQMREARQSGGKP